MIYLNVKYSQKDEAKAMGAKWDSVKKKWYVPESLDPSPFQKWLPPQETNLLVADQETNTAYESLASTDTTHNLNNVNTADSNFSPQSPINKISLSAFLQKINLAIQTSFQDSIWIVAEIVNISDRGHLYFELAENDNGVEVAKCRAIIWRDSARLIRTRFEKATGEVLRSGIKILFSGKPRFHPQYSFSIEIDDINPEFTLGEIRKKLLEIRNTLIQKKLYDKNKSLPKVDAFNRIAVIAPPKAAGLGDFKIEADLLAKHSICLFDYYPTAFQGERVIAEFQKSFEIIARNHQNQPYDAVVIIRGGGATSDLLYLNELVIAELLCNCSIPVFCGIGHEKDNTILDEVAQLRFDTPSKVIQYILERIVTDAQNAIANWNFCKSAIQELISKSKLDIINLFRQIEGLATAQTKQQLNQISTTFLLINEKTTETALIAKFKVKQLYETTLSKSCSLLSLTRMHLQSEYEQISFVRPIRYQKNILASLIERVLNRNPKKVLQQGYAIARDNNNKVITSKKTAESQAQLSLEFADGLTKVKPILENK